MSKEKQIEEMARVISEIQYLGGLEHKLAELLFERGYRKQKGYFLVKANGDIVPIGQSEWISVEDRLPNPGEEVLVCDEVGDVFTDLIECDGKWGEEISRRWGVKYIYWMPLPAPPKMKGGANNDEK